MACEACNAKFSFFTRKKQCVDCLRHFCSECVIKRLDKILNCDTCNMLSRRPLTQSLIAQMRSKDIRQYLLAKKISIEGCIEKEDLIKLLIAFANGTNVYQDTEDTRNVDYPPSNRSATNYEQSAQILNRVQEINTTRVGSSDSEIPETVSTIDLCSDERADPIRSDEKMISKISNIQHSDILVETSTNPVKLSDINALSELERLSVKQLKNLLSTNRVDYKGCVERYELLNRASRLWEEYIQSRRTKMENLDENLCKICWDEPIECVILECGHMACCLNCGKQMSECPICKQYVVRVVRFFKA